MQRERAINYIEQLESESIFILREVAAQFERPIFLYSIGKDSSVLLHLARKAFAPAKMPFKLLHIDTGYEFTELYEFRDKFVAEIGAELVIYRNEPATKEGTDPLVIGTQACCGKLKSQALLDALRSGGYDVAIGGARRVEETSRAKERIFSFRDQFGQWEPRRQRPELWSLYNGRINKGESIRVFPLSNWTELDIWHYIHNENIKIVTLYLAKERAVIQRNSQLIPYFAGSSRLLPSEKVEQVMCRFRTLGCIPCTGAIRSTATDTAGIIEEMIFAKTSERATRIIDHDSAGSMEKKKCEGYF